MYTGIHLWMLSYHIHLCIHMWDCLLLYISFTPLLKKSAELNAVFKTETIRLMFAHTFNFSPPIFCTFYSDHCQYNWFVHIEFWCLPVNSSYFWEICCCNSVSFSRPFLRVTLLRFYQFNTISFLNLLCHFVCFVKPLHFLIIHTCWINLKVLILMMILETQYTQFVLISTLWISYIYIDRTD